MESIPVMLKIDKDRERHIYDELSKLSKERKISEEVGKAVREYYNSSRGSRHDIAETFFNAAGKQVAEMHRKVDAIYKMCLDMYTLNKFRARKLPDERIQAIESSRFMLERQMTSLCTTLGIRDNLVFEANKLKDSQKIAEDALEYIIESFEGIVGELVEMATPVHTPMNVMPVLMGSVEAAKTVGPVDSTWEKDDTCAKKQDESAGGQDDGAVEQDNDFAVGDDAAFLDNLIGGDDDF